MYPSLRRNLKASKDKLCQNQDLVAYVQQSPERLEEAGSQMCKCVMSAVRLVIYVVCVVCHL